MTLSPSDQAIYSLEVWKYFSVIGPALLVYDYLLTFDLEYTYVWKKRPWSTVNTLYVLSRYMPFIDSCLVTLYRTFVPWPSLRSCNVLLGIELYMALVGIGISELIIVLRTWVVWERNQLVGLLLAIQGTACGAVTMWCTTSWFVSLPWVQGINGCASSSGEKLQYINWALYIFSDSLMLALMLSKLCRNQSQLRRIRGVARLLVLNGVLYFMILFVLAVPCIVLSLFNNTEYAILSQIVTNPTRILHSIFASRMLLHIRQELDQRIRGDAFLMSTLDSIAFTWPSQTGGTEDMGLSYEMSPPLTTTDGSPEE